MSKPRILICDDEKGVRESLRLILDKDYELSFAANGQEALDHLQGHEADLAILDIKMPRLNGLEALKELRRLRPALRILMITGYESGDIASEAIQLGADDYLTKPFEREKVRQKVRALLP